MRLFVSIKPPEETLTYLESCIADLANANKRLTIKWSDRSLLHLTVLFLGEVEEEDLHFVKKEISDACKDLQPFFVDLSAPELLFKNKKPSHVIMKVFDQSGILQQLHTRLYERLGEKITLDTKKFLPHITLGKVKTTMRLQRKISIQTGHIDSVFPVEEIELVDSNLTPIGPLYTTLDNFSLKDA